MGKILIADDEEAIRSVLAEIFQDEGHETEEAVDGKDAIEKIQSNKYDVIFCDVKMPKIDGTEVLTKAVEITPETPFVVITGHGTVELAVESIKKGAFDFLNKPMDINKILVTLRNALERNTLEVQNKVLSQENKTLRKKVSKVREIIGETEEIKIIKATIEKVAQTDARVLVTGSNGTGKELVARWIHEFSARNGSPIVEVNCAAIPSELIESELFGHEKGAFTSAIKQRIGKFESANGGTLFLDEIGDMSLSAQAKVLRALQESKITRVGGEKEFSVNVRVIAATNKNLQEEIAKGNFREDLYHRLAVILIHVPSLNDRRDDIPLIANAFLNEISNEYGKKEFTPEAMETLKSLNWTGNIRELRNVVERLAILSGNKITVQDVELFGRAKPTGSAAWVDFSSFENEEEMLKWVKEKYHA